MARGKRTLNVSGLDELIQALETMTPNTEIICENVAYEGIQVVADTMKEQLNALKTTADDTSGSSSSKRYSYAWEKEAVVDGMGVSPVKKENGVIDYKVGFSDYVERNGKQKAVAMIANSINAGTSFSNSQPFIKKTVSNAKKEAIEVMETELQKEIDKYIN